MSEFKNFIGTKLINNKPGPKTTEYTPRHEKKFTCVDCGEEYTWIWVAGGGRPPLRCEECRKDKTNNEFSRIFLDFISQPDVACWCTKTGQFHIFYQNKDYISSKSFKDCFLALRKLCHSNSSGE